MEKEMPRMPGRNKKKEKKKKFIKVNNF